MADDYDVLPMADNLGGIYDTAKDAVKPFVGIYFPAELLNKMKWTKETRLTLSIEKDCLKIVKSASDEKTILSIPED